MSHLLRCGLVAVSLVAAFAAGFLLKPVPAVPTVAAEPASHTAAKPPAPLPDVIAPLPDPAVKPATALGEPRSARPEPADPLDAAGMAMIRKEMGLPTTILNKSEPVPAVLADAQARGTSSPIPKIDLELPPPPGPVPMGGPMPRLEVPPAPTIPTVRDDAPPLPPVAVPPLPTPPPSPALVNTRAVALDFEVTKTGSSPVTAVELWTTRDGGATWAKTDRMAGARSPFRTQLGSEGVYGFRLVFESESGMRSAEPKRGDGPDLSVELDATPPAVTLLAPQPIPGHSGSVRLRWVVADAHPDATGTRLEYSPDGESWRPIAGGITGPLGNQAYFYDWAPPPGVPPRVLVRVSCRDRAGNAATAATADKVSIDLVAPAGKVTGVRPAAGEVGPMPREVGAASVLPIRATLAAPLPGLLGSPVLLR